MSYNIDLSGRVALVTGASSGLGAQFARTLAKAGAGVALAGRRVERLKTLRAEIEAEGGDAHVVALDVTDHDSIKAAVAHTETEMGTIDILVNNSGVATTQKLVDVTLEDYDYVFDTNTKGAFFVAQEVGKRMLARAKGAAPGTFTGGRIVNIASIAGLRVFGQIGVYCMSKAALVHMTRAMALEWGRYGINVNAICPGATVTFGSSGKALKAAMAQGLSEDQAIEQVYVKSGRFPEIGALGRPGRPEDQASAVAFLVSSEASFITGQAINVCGGQLMGI